MATGIARSWWLLLGLAALLSLTACSGGSGGTSAGTTTTTTTTPTPAPDPTATVETLYSFGKVPQEGTQPISTMLKASDGNLYFPTGSGGRYVCDSGFSCGAIMRATPAGVVTTMFSFGERPELGYFPTGPLVEANDGSLLGTALAGPNNAGIVYRITKGGDYRVIASFGTSASDGATPIGRLVVMPDGSIYGVTSSGGSNYCPSIPGSANNCGTLFKVAPDGTRTTVHSFGGTADAPNLPQGIVYNPADGNIYGAAQGGGGAECKARSGVPSGSGCGALFRYNPRDGFSVVHRFSSVQPNGIAPQGAPVVAADGTMYGATASGGTGVCNNDFSCGTLYRFTTAGQFTLLHQFATAGVVDGYGPGPELLIASDGNLYGVTCCGGAIGEELLGTIWRFSTAGRMVKLFSFGPRRVKPYEPTGGLVEIQPLVFLGFTRNNDYNQLPANPFDGTLYRVTVK